MIFEFAANNKIVHGQIKTSVRESGETTV